MHGMRVVIGSLALGAAYVVTGPQGAHAGSNLCDANRVCIYDRADWVGLLGQRSAGGGLVNVSSGANDLTSSWENKTSTNARFYEHADGKGFCVEMTKRLEDNYVGDAYNDKLTSWATNGGC